MSGRPHGVLSFKNFSHTVINGIKRYPLRTIFLALLITIVLLLVVFSADNHETTVITNSIPTVTVSSVSELSNQNSVTTVGTVEAISEVQLKAEAGGRVTAVTAELGNTVRAGTVIARLENASQQAALLQAQGAYEAALASANQSNVGVQEAATALTTAKSNARTTNAAAYNTVAGLVKTDIDQFFSNPESLLPTLIIQSYGQSSDITKARVAVKRSLTTWQSESSTPTDPTVLIQQAKLRTDEVLALVDSLLTALTNDKPNSATESTLRTGRIATLTNTRATLLGTKSSLQGAETAITAATDAMTRAEMNSTNNAGPSASQAQITQALGVLRAAQANYEKTLVRTSITGVVNALYVKRGDFTAPMQDVAVVANNNGQQISTAITESDRNFITIGDTVQLDNTATGTVTAIAGAVDEKTGKIAVKISVSTPNVLVTGTTVSVNFTQNVATTTSTVASPISIPLTAVKLMSEGAVVFTIGASSTVVATPVTLGRVLGNTIIVTDGIDDTTHIVTDARGLKNGDTVLIK